MSCPSIMLMWRAVNCAEKRSGGREGLVGVLAPKLMRVHVSWHGAQLRCPSSNSVVRAGSVPATVSKGLQEFLENQCLVYDKKAAFTAILTTYV